MMGSQLSIFQLQIYQEDFSWEIFVFQKTKSKQLTYVSRLPSYIFQSNVQ